MSECIIDLESFNQESRDKVVFYSSSTEIIYRDGNFIKLASCDGKELSKINVPLDPESFELVERDSTVIFLFGGRTLVFMDKAGDEPYKQDLDTLTIGKVITPLFLSQDQNALIFGTERDGHLQFVTYDFDQKKRLVQTRSWAMSKITHVNVKDDYLYAILDQSLVLKCNMMTGETDLNRFEAGQVNKSFLPYNDGFWYPCQLCLRTLSDDSVKTARIPLVRVWTIEHIVKHKLYLTSKEGKNLCCYDLNTGAITWEIFGNDVIHETIIVHGDRKGKECDVMVLRINNHIGLINLSDGKSVGYIMCQGVYRIRQTGDHVIASKHNGTTMLIPSKQDEVDDWN